MLFHLPYQLHCWYRLYVLCILILFSTLSTELSARSVKHVKAYHLIQISHLVVRFGSRAFITSDNVKYLTDEVTYTGGVYKWMYLVYIVVNPDNDFCQYAYGLSTNRRKRTVDREYFCGRIYSSDLGRLSISYHSFLK